MPEEAALEETAPEAVLEAVEDETTEDDEVELSIT